MNYKEAVEYMEQCSSYGSVLGLDNIRKLLSLLGDPHKELVFIHVAGTNGKGSVCCFMRTVLSGAGYRTGCFTSPAVMDPMEVIKVGERSISRRDYAAYLSRVREAADCMEPHPTVFEMELALALLYFREKMCDIVILECGLGGAKDATNVIDAPALSVFSSISMDHSAVLGKTLGKIAENKAGIIKKGSGVVSLSQEEEAGQCLKRRAAREGAKYYEADPELCVSVKSSRPGETVFDIDTGRMKDPERELMRSLFSSEERREEGTDTGHDGGRTRKTRGDDGGAAGIAVADGIIRDIAISLNGVWQIENAMVALLALAVLRSMGYDLIHEKQVRKYLKKAVHPGRFEVLGSDPAMVIDGAHNPDAALKLRESIDTYFGGRRLIFIIGVFADKDYDSILRYTCDKADMVITTSTPGNPRALSSIELAQAASEYNKNVTAADSVEEAFQMAYMMAGKKDVILAFGSLSYLGRLKKIYADREKKI